MSEKSPSIEQVRSLIPLFKEEYLATKKAYPKKFYQRLSLRHKGYYDYLKTYNLLGELDE